MSDDPGETMACGSGIPCPWLTMSIIPFSILSLASFLVPFGPTRLAGPVEETMDNFFGPKALPPPTGLPDVDVGNIPCPLPLTFKESGRPGTGFNDSLNLYTFGEADPGL